MEDRRVVDLAKATLAAADRVAESTKHDVTIQAQAFIAAGTLSMADVLDVLHISRATWYRRLEALRDWEAARSETNGDPE
jgi:hypothetical protein